MTKTSSSMTCSQDLGQRMRRRIFPPPAEINQDKESNKRPAEKPVMLQAKCNLKKLIYTFGSSLPVYSSITDGWWTKSSNYKSRRLIAVIDVSLAWPSTRIIGFNDSFCKPVEGVCVSLLLICFSFSCSSLSCLARVFTSNYSGTTTVEWATE